MYLRLPIFTDEGEPTGQVLVVSPSAIQEGWIETAIVPPPADKSHEPE